MSIMDGNMKHFVKGKHYYHVNGEHPFIVLRERSNDVQVCYVGSGYLARILKSKIKGYEKENDMTKYKVKGYQKGCTLVGSNIDGFAVMQDCNKLLFTVAYSSIEEIVPYTVGIRFKGSHKVYHYLSRQGDVSVGERLFVNDDLAKVVEVNTRAKSARVQLSGEKISTTPIDLHYNS